MSLTSATWPSRPARVAVVDGVAVLVAVALPWSTSAVGILVALWLIALSFAVDLEELFAALRRPASIFPMALFALAIAGMSWSEALWPDRLRGVSPVAKLIVLPLLIYHFQRSKRGHLVFAAFLASCTLLMLLSWLVVFEPQWTLKPNVNPGLPIKDYIIQSQEFALCALGAVWPAVSLLRARRFAPAILLFGLSLAFLANMVFVIIARTALVYLPVMFGLAAWSMFSRRAATFVAFALIVAFAVIGMASPRLHAKAAAIFAEYNLYRSENATTSVGERLEFWRKSLRFVGAAPLIGHGTGAIRSLFDKAAIGQTGVSAETIRNPHNQTLNVAIQWGLLGCVVLYGMWASHLALFCSRGLAAWIGHLVVGQNIVSSLFNSHLFDFTEGWIYVIGVGVAGGMLRAGAREYRLLP